ncbi:MAG: class I SAM-dependent methyltransferase [Chloroflexi bacterium]|nr:class I SAM-dependent methyltransferase [Chloroflexota bacterium]
MTSYSNYDRFARVYNQHWGNEFVPLALQVLEKLVFTHLPAKARILDLCCGTGQLAQALIGRHYRVTGLDASQEMLRFARENAPAGEFIMADARSFKLPPVYHAVVSTFDSLNHIMSLEELTAVFGNVYAALRPGGLFLFDLNMAAGYQACWDDNYGIVADDHVCVVRLSYRPQERTARFDTTIFYLEEGWQRADVTVMQKCYLAAEVESALDAAGFIQIQAYAYNERLALAKLTNEAERAFFIAQKP